MRTEKRIKPTPKKGKYVYEYVFAFEDGMITEYLGKIKYLKVYNGGGYTYAVEKHCHKMHRIRVYLRKEDLIRDLKEKPQNPYESRTLYRIYCMDTISRKELEACINKEVFLEKIKKRIEVLEGWQRNSEHRVLEEKKRIAQYQIDIKKLEKKLES